MDNNEREHPISSFRLSTKVEGSILHETDSLYVKSSVFDSQIHNITFKVNTELTEDLKLSFNIPERPSGRLIMLVNGQQILSEELDESSKVVTLPVELLDRYNTLTIGVSSPGWAFWQYNEYTITNLQITGDVKDTTGSSSSQIFTLAEEEVDYIERALLKFYADCTPTSAGRLEIKLNGRRIFSGFGDCGVLNKIELDQRSLDWGENELSFSSEQGSYLFTNVEVKTYLEEAIYPIYYFDIDDAYFTTTKDDDDALCGEVDGFCPYDCGSDIDKDCCFEESTTHYWCDFDTAQLGDRCVSFVTESTCSRCDSGYENYRGQPAEACEDTCGDDKDGECPVGCSKYVDKDCCFEESEDYYWCDDAPVNRPISAVCKAGVEPDERNDCPSKYFNDNGKRLTPAVEYGEDDDSELSSRYKVLLNLDFPNDELKTATITVNGRDMGLQTRDIEYEKDISDYVRTDTNSIEIVPARSLDITQLEVKVIRRS